MLARVEAWGEALNDRPWRVALLLALVAQAVFTIHLGRPDVIVFDEVHYVSAARVLLALELPVNTEHPLVGKAAIALGIALFGDTPFGWRILPAMAGTATVLAAFAFLWLLLRDLRTAVVGALLVLLNQTLFVQARTAMLDVFYGAFLLWALVLMLAAMQRVGAWRAWSGAALCFGLAVGTKWAAIPWVGAAGLAFLAIRLWEARAGAIHSWRGLAAVPALAVLGTVSVATYCLTFLPAFFYAADPLTLAGFIPFQEAMYATQTSILPHHNYQSDWWSWPVIERPIWYFYEPVDGIWRGVLLVGNPLVMWGGLAGVGLCLWAGIRHRAAAPLAVALLWAFSWLIYWIIPKSLGFYYYYHVSGVLVAMALATAFHALPALRRRGIDIAAVWAALALFLYFYPILSAAALPNSQAFNNWMWFDRWR